MSLKIYEQLEQRTEEWLEARRGIVTASTVGKLITPKTVKPAANPESRALLQQLVAERVSGWVEETPTTNDMWRGIESEPIARDLYSEKYAPVVEVGFMRRDETDWTLGYSPDGLVGDVGLIEVKSPRPRTHVATILSGDVPVYHMAQLQAGLLVSGREWIDYISFHGGLPMWTKRVHPDQKWFDAIIEAVRDFEHHAQLMVAMWNDTTRHLPQTERLPQYDEVVLKL